MERGQLYLNRGENQVSLFSDVLVPGCEASAPRVKPQANKEITFQGTGSENRGELPTLVGALTREAHRHLVDVVVHDGSWKEKR